MAMLTIRHNQIQQMAQASPGRQMIMPCNDNKTWVEVRLVDQNDVPVPDARCQVQLPDGSIMEGSLDSMGAVRFDSIVAGTCKVTFPEIHSTEWHTA